MILGSLEVGSTLIAGVSTLVLLFSSFSLLLQQKALFIISSVTISFIVMFYFAYNLFSLNIVLIAGVLLFLMNEITYLMVKFGMLFNEKVQSEDNLASSLFIVRHVFLGFLLISLSALLTFFTFSISRTYLIGNVALFVAVQSFFIFFLVLFLVSHGLSKTKNSEM
jgi:hypothetical protein